MSRVAVWMPVYNEERHLRAALQSLFMQSFQDFTLFISDNHSTDATAGIIQKYANIYLPEGAPRKHGLYLWRPPVHLAGIPHMKFCWDSIPEGFDYSIQIGGHDVWPANYLEKLVERMDGEIKARGPEQPVALCYPDTFQLNEKDEIVGRYQDIMQIGQIGLAMIPQYVIAGVNSPHVFGLWNEKVRREIPFRHACSGWDHLVVAEAALRGMILFEGQARLSMRCPKEGECTLERYGERHLSAEQRAAGTLDFYQQLEWLVHCVDIALESIPAPARPLYTALLTNSMFSTYVALRGLNLNICPGAMQAFNADPRVRELFSAAAKSSNLLRELLVGSHSHGVDVAKLVR